MGKAIIDNWTKEQLEQFVKDSTNMNQVLDKVGYTVYSGFRILWSGDIGWGEYTLYKKIGNNNEWFWDDEHMENPEGDKAFLKLLLNDFATQIEVK